MWHNHSTELLDRPKTCIFRGGFFPVSRKKNEPTCFFSSFQFIITAIYLWNISSNQAVACDWGEASVRFPTNGHVPTFTLVEIIVFLFFLFKSNSRKRTRKSLKTPSSDTRATSRDLTADSCSSTGKRVVLSRDKPIAKNLFWLILTFAR